MSTNPSHDWATRRLLAYSVGLMPEDELLRLEEHLAGCPECRARLAPLKAAAGAGAGHLPSSLIATWPRSSRLLEGLERELVEAHLEDCEECRAALAFAGHQPVVAPALSRAGSESASGTSRAPAPSRRHFWAWASGLAGAAAGLLAWAAATHPGWFERGPHTFGTMGGSAHPVAVAFEFALDSLTTGAVRLPEPGFRARAAKPIDVGAVTNVSGMVLILPPALQPPSPEAGERRMVITLLQDGRELASHTGPFYTLGDAIRLRPEGRLEAGDYDLRFALDPAAAGEPALVWFYRLRVR
jgi:hypothetical protein